jgi:hypothetical protein
LFEGLVFGYRALRSLWMSLLALGLGGGLGMFEGI